MVVEHRRSSGIGMRVLHRSAASAQRPLSSTCSTREAVAAWSGRSADRAGPTPTPWNGTDGAPDEFPARTTTLETVKGRRFSSSERRAAHGPPRRLHRDEGPGQSAIDRPGERGAVQHGYRRILAEGHFPERGPGVGLGAGSDHDPAAGLTRPGLGQDHLERQRRGRRRRKPSVSTTLSGIPITRRPSSWPWSRRASRLRVPFALDLDEETRLGQRRRLDQLARIRVVERLDEPRGQRDLVARS